jgi:pilus assembly protein CpaC
MLEVKVAEISKTLLDKLGVGLSLSRQTSSGSWTYGLISGFLTDSAGKLLGIRANGNYVQIDAEKADGLIKILAEPTIVAISGQEASFLAGGKVFLPVATPSTVGLSTITLQEQDFGVGLKFTPTVLDGGRINLQVAPEVSEPVRGGSVFTTVGGATAVLPTFTTRRAQTTVQLFDGQSLAIAGLIKNNLGESIKRFPVLGEVPILGALFRSNEFATERSELVFVITPRLVQPLGANPALPTDSFVPPSRTEFFLGGKLEGSGHPEVPPDRPVPGAPAGGGQAQPAPPQGGFQLK